MKPTQNLRRIALGAALAAAAIGCGKAPELTSVRDVRPTTLEIGEKLVVETSVPLVAGAPTTVELDGVFLPPGAKTAEPKKLVLTGARATSPAGRRESTRVLADIDAYVEEQVGGHVTFWGKVSVLQGDQVVADTGNRAIQLDLFPATVRKLAHELVGERSEDALLSWLGLRVRPVAGALEVLRVRQAFNGVRFIAETDCGTWDERAAACRAPLDGKVSKKEAEQRGVAPELFAELDDDKDGEVDRHEAKQHDRPASPAAVAGLAPGDRILTAGGKPVTGADELAAAWDGEGATVALTVARAGVEVKTTLPRYGKPPALPSGILFSVILVLVGLLVVLPVPLLGGIIVVWERKIAGRMQSRPGPNRVGPNGWLQFLADGVKLIVKEDIIPKESDSILFRLSPFLVFTGVFLTFVVMPFGQMIVVADLNIGILYLLSVTSLVVVGIIMGGWASNSKWSLLGGMRSAAQIISYELPASIAVLSVVTLAGTLSTQGLVLNQGGSPWNWHLFDNPFTFACFFIYFVSALAEGNRTPFDLPEAESELVAGYNTEYSGFRFAIFFLSEWVNLIVIGAVATTVFLGGWRIPGVSPGQVEASLLLQLASFGVFALKTLIMIFVIIWVRWTLPRFRIDQMMSMCWKYFLPLSLVSLIATTLIVWAFPYPALPRVILRWAMFLVAGCGTLIWFASRVYFTSKTTKVLELRGA